MQLNNAQAAYLYLVIVNIGESSNSELEQLCGFCEGLLYGTPYDDATIDTELQPMIDWESFESGFNYEIWLFGTQENIDRGYKAEIVHELECLEPEDYYEQREVLLAELEKQGR